MRLVCLVATLPLTSAIPRSPPGKHAEIPSPNWDGRTYYPQNDESNYNSKNDGPFYNPRNDRRLQKHNTKAVVDRTDNTESLAALNQTVAPIPETIDIFEVTILADSNRDGKVDTIGDTDLTGKNTWTEESGALFLANIVDTDRRCSSQIFGSCANSLSDTFLEGFLPKKPELDPNILEKIKKASHLPDWPLSKRSDGLLSESEETQFNEWEKKIEAYEKEYRDAQNVDKSISACHDSSDNVLRNSSYLAPLRTTTNPGLSDSAIGSITVTNEIAASKVRLFHKSVGQWTFITSNYIFTAQHLKAGLELGIDARDVRRPGGWDGRVTVEFKVKDRGKEARDWVSLRVAPVLTQHHGQTAEQLLTAGPPEHQGWARFAKDLAGMSRTAGLKKPMHIFDVSGCGRIGTEIWAQDFFEPGYMSIPGPDGPVGLHILIRSAQTYRPSGRKIFQDLRSSTVGAVQHLADGDVTDATGNLETVPPYTHNGKSYTAGRAIMGSADGKKPEMMTFLEAQETQDPIELDTSWLAIKHVDEFMQFIPVKSKRGWVMMVDDPRAGLEILQKAQQAGHGKDMAVSRPKASGDPLGWPITNTIDDVLNFTDFGAVNVTDFAGFQNFCASSIEKNIDIIKRETGITDAEIFRIPSLYTTHRRRIWQYSGGNMKRRQTHDPVPGQEIEGHAIAKIPDILEAGTPPDELDQLANMRVRGLVRRADSGDRAASLYPSTINSVVLSSTQILAANPWGPIIEGQDVLKAAVDEAYAKANYTVRFIDDWFTHHYNHGDVHCGTNVIRDITGAKWW